MRALSLLSLCALTLAACDATDPAAFQAQHADTTTGSHINGVDPNGVLSGSNVHWIEQAQRNTVNMH
jgi:hypothetical protein